jgi:SHS2 domain-containing protein
MRQGYELVDHTADVGVRAWAPQPAGVFEEAAKGMFSLICDPMTIDREETIEVAVEAAQPDQLLVAWLNELLYRFESSRLLPVDFEVTAFDGRHLRATVHGEPLDPSRHAICGGVKAATLHELSLTSGPTGSEAFVLLDV